MTFIPAVFSRRSFPFLNFQYFLNFFSSHHLIRSIGYSQSTFAAQFYTGAAEINQYLYQNQQYRNRIFFHVSL